jgi:hypothetical protein
MKLVTTRPCINWAWFRITSLVLVHGSLYLKRARPITNKTALGEEWDLNYVGWSMRKVRKDSDRCLRTGPDGCETIYAILSPQVCPSYICKSLQKTDNWKGCYFFTQQFRLKLSPVRQAGQFQPTLLKDIKSSNKYAASTLPQVSRYRRSKHISTQ